MENSYFNTTDKIRFLLLILSGVLLSGCSDFIEEDISNDTVQMIIPQSGATLTSNNVHFKWDELKGADSYRLQLVQPSFSSIQDFLLDSLIANTEFYYILNPGDYEFQIRGENSAYETVYSGPYAFTVDSVSDLSGQSISLVAPLDMYYTNQTDFTASWQNLYAADYYEFQIRSGSNFSAGSILLTVSNVYGLSYATSSGPFSVENYYSWGTWSWKNSWCFNSYL